MRIQKIQTNPYQQNKKNPAFKANVAAEIRFKYNQEVDIVPLGIKALTEAIRRNFIDLDKYMDSPSSYKPVTMGLDNFSARFLIEDAEADKMDIKNLSGDLSEDGKTIKWDIKSLPIGL